MKHTIVALMQDHPGVLHRVVSLFRRRGYNIESLAVGRTETPGISPTGKNTATIEKVVATTASPISSAASIDA